MQISFESKAPAFANVDNIKEKMEKHFGRIYENVADYIKILKEEETSQPRGERLKQLELRSGRKCDLYKFSLEDESFHETSFYM